MSERAKADEKAHRLIEAAEWRMCLNEAELETSPEFEAWMAVPANVDAWAQASALWGFLGDNAREPEMVAAREEALGAARRSLAQRRQPISAWRHSLTAMLIIVLIAGLSWGAVLFIERPDSYVTAFGERRVVTLIDGSRVSLDSDSKVTVRYSRTARELQLVRGQARFDVSHDVARPFSVLAGSQKVIATGTAFNIDITETKVSVTLIEGHVVVLDEHAPAKMMPIKQYAPPRLSTQLHAGQQLVAFTERPAQIETPNIQRIIAWTNGQLIFSDEPLSEVVARISRYSKTPIIINDPQINNERISGVFNTGDVPGFLDIVTQYYPVKAVTDDTGRIILEKI
jgi:transmembrane sensor